MFYRRMVRPWLFRMGRGDPEVAHERTVGMLADAKPWMLSSMSKLYSVSDPRRVFGIEFPNAVGLAAGMDKDGAATAAWPSLGFGFVELGTVTWRAQPGNPRPRLYRLPESKALINRMGFNNNGAQALAAELGRGPKPEVPIGISLGKSKATPLEHAVDDYLASFTALYRYGDYFAVNVSSPNTPGLRTLQDAEALTTILRALVAEASHLSGGRAGKPILVKIAPDLTEPAIAQALEVCYSCGAAGVIAANTTLARDGVAPSENAKAAQSGGLSGKPLLRITEAIVKFVHRETGGKLPIIGVGGIGSPGDALRLMDAGSSLVQVFTGLVYNGPSLVRRSARAIRKAEAGPPPPPTRPRSAPRPHPQPQPQPQPRDDYRSTQDSYERDDFRQPPDAYGRDDYRQQQGGYPGDDYRQPPDDYRRGGYPPDPHPDDGYPQGGHPQGGTRHGY
ncbi:MAG TPA: quinone-dependent dihydroorotate dehydrogenase [Stackebrandtia sp.]|jgi:dihydroorotate dehydrogenase|nr:quinone-dependent dihydroorotate dehydrogenase [Stackebrandtia sp.]HZE39827.1 quinone-dependent dihydroorotate dehydrogenase [Stackebrandtia sp.]